LVAVKHLSEAFDARAALLLPDSTQRLRHPQSAPVSGSLLKSDLAVAQWVFDQSAQAGLGTNTLPGAPVQYLPLKSDRGMLGVLAVEPNKRRRLLLPEQHHFLETFAVQIALALERADLEKREKPASSTHCTWEIGEPAE